MIHRSKSTVLLQIDSASGVSKQAQIREYFVKAILSRRLSQGESLPSTRRLATQLKVSRNTVMLAYQALIDNGYVEAKDRSAFVVSADAPLSRIVHNEASLTSENTVKWQDKLIESQPSLRIIDKPLDWREYEYPFNYGQSDASLFSHSEWRDCARQALGVRNFGMIAGDFGQHDDPMLVEYISSHSLPRRGITASPEQILVTLGAQNALFLLMMLLVDKRRKVIIEEPCYPELRALLSGRHADITHLPVDDEGIILDEKILAKADIVIITPSHQSPTTATLSLERRKRLLELAVEHDFLIIEDDYEFEMNFLEAPSPALKSMDESGHVIYVGSFSKSLFPGLRLGYLVASEELIRAARNLRHLMLRHPPGQTQRTAAYFMALGHYDAQIHRLRRHFEGRRRVLQKALAGAPMLRATGAHFGGTSFWIQAPDWLDSGVLAERAAKESVLIEAGEAFFAESHAPKNYFRLGYSSISEDKIAAGFERLRVCIEALSPSK